MPFAWILNLDAELELSGPGYNRGAKIGAQLARHVALAREQLLGPHDRLLDEGTLDGGAYVGRAWCPTPQALAAFARAGVTPEPHPNADVIRRVNHRRFAFDLGAGPPGARWLQAPERVRDRVLAGGRDWLLKRPLSFAGRGQLRLRDRISAVDQTWIDASLADDGLVLEPLVELLEEFSQHGFIRRDGGFALGRPCVQTTARGVFRDVRPAGAGDLDDLERRELEHRTTEVAAALVSAGYFGPFGIDAYRYRLDGATSFCALSEINARYTMSFAVGFPEPPSKLVL